MTWLLCYIAIGIVFNLAADLLVDHYERSSTMDADEMRFDLFTKVLTGLLWPLAIIYIAVVAYKHYIK